MNDSPEYSERLLQLAADERLFGRMNAPTGAAFTKGQCGDQMEFHLFIRSGVIEEAKYWTDGCEVTRACGAWVAEFATGRSVTDALGVNPKQIAEAFPDIPEGHRHCPILAVVTFLKAVADYLLKP